MKRVCWTMLLVFGALLLAEMARGEDATARQLRAALEENMAACTEEDLPRLMKTMSAEMPNRELFMEQCKKEWANHNIYYRLVDVKVVKQGRWKLPYVVATVTEEQRDYNPEEGQENAPVEDLSHVMSIRTKTPVTQSEYLFKREGGNWKIVAGVSEERPVEPAAIIQVGGENCRNGRCDKSGVRSAFK